MKRLFYTLLLLIVCYFGFQSCKQSNVSSAKDRESIQQDSLETYNRVKIFGVPSQKDELSVIKSLEGAGIITVDTIRTSDNKFQSAIVEFAGVKFGMNQGFIFITSRHDKATITALVKAISQYYGEPDVDGDDEEEPEYNYYHWNLYDGNAEAPYIRIRPLHSEEGGLTMTWRFYN